MRWLLYLALGLGVICAGLYLFEVRTKDILLTQSGGSMRELAAELAEAFPGAANICLSEQFEDHLDELMAAITIAELYGTTQFERSFEEAVVNGLDLIGQQPPDYSLGPGQIRPSTVIKALSLQKSANGSESLSREILARRLLDPCWNHRFGVAVLRWIVTEHHIDETILGPSEIHTIARSFNGAGSVTSVDGWVAQEAYAELVYHLYNELRFRRIKKM